MWGLTASYLAIDMEEGKEVVWNEIEVLTTNNQLLTKLIHFVRMLKTFLSYMTTLMSI